jgi:hypothetical protein
MSAGFLFRDSDTLSSDEIQNLGRLSHETPYKSGTQGCYLITKMPPQPTITQIRLDNIIICLNAAVTTLEALSKKLKTPFLGPIVITMWSLLAVLQVSLAHPNYRELTASE